MPPGFVEACLAPLREGTSLLALSAALVAISFLLVTALRAILGEYAKRLWFRREFLDSFTRLERNLARAQADQAALREESTRIRAILERFIAENDRLHAELITARLSRAALNRDPSGPEGGSL